MLPTSLEVRGRRQLNSVMQATKRTELAALSLVALVGCAPSAPPAVAGASDEAAIRARGQSHADTFNAGDADKIVALCAEDAVFMPSDAPIAVGREAIRKYYARSIAG